MERLSIPENGRPRDEMVAEMEDMRSGDAQWRAGRTWSLVYYGGDEHHETVRQANNLFLDDNALNPMAFKSLKAMESQVVSMAASMLNAPAEAVGTMTSGGTESILLAVKAARDRARAKKPWIRRPEIVAPRTLHVAFDKACHYFGLRARYTAVDDNGQAIVGALEKAVGRNTVLIAASAPQYVTGTIDPIPEIGAIAARKKIPFHVDACFGGFILPWLERIGVSMPIFDFRVPGVTSMSADVHKYGYAPKGSSTIVYRDMSYLRHQFYVSTDWPGGIYISPTMQGTRSGGSIAAAWASMMAMGQDGYIERARTAMAVADRLRAGISSIPGLSVRGLPHSPVVTYGSDDEAVDLYAVADQLEAKGWSVDRQQDPPTIHLTCNTTNAPTVDPYLADLRAAAEHVRAHPELRREGDAAVYGMMSRVPLKGLVKRGVLEIMEKMYAPGVESAKLDDLEDDSFTGRLMDKYGDRVLDAFEAAQRWLPGRRGR